MYVESGKKATNPIIGTSSSRYVFVDRKAGMAYSVPDLGVSNQVEHAY